MTNSAQVQRAIDAQIGKSRARFMDRLDQQVRDLDDLMAHLEDCPGDHAALQRAMGQVHKISGVAATLGFAEIGELAQAAERKLMACTPTSGDAVLDQAIDAVEALAAEMDRLDGLRPAAGPAGR